ncbi:DUF1906 domain-containing protein [Mycobacterium gordonae]|nr:glycoside hydrolase domain-containing protein [Mycobacterium gordonae]MCQ4364537.1 DUF1906 domain-containing protein [Mycobacterium gordonae]
MASKQAAKPKPSRQLRIDKSGGKVKYHPLAPGTHTGQSSGYRTGDRPDHRGVDIAASHGTPIYAPADGFFVHVGINDDPGGFGSWLWIDAQQEWDLDFVLGHMPPSSLVNPDTGQPWKTNERVRAGQQIAVVGSEGGSSGPHLHFETWGPPGRKGGQDRDPNQAWLIDAVDPRKAPKRQAIEPVTSLVGQLLVDYSAGVPSAEQIRAAGYAGAVRYVSDPREDWMRGKPLRKQEADDLRSHGLAVVSNYQFGKAATADWKGGAAQGRKDAERGLRLHTEAGGPNTAPIYVSIDACPSEQEWNTQCRPYLLAWQERLGKERMGVYCNFPCIEWAIRDGIGTYFWMHNWDEGYSGGQVHPAAHLHQFEIDKQRVGGVGVDRNRILREDFGQWDVVAVSTATQQDSARWKMLKRLGSLDHGSGADAVAEVIIGETLRRRYNRDEVIACLSTAIQESGLRPDAIGGGGAWHGIYQQDESYPGRDDPNENIRVFLDRLDEKRCSAGASPDVWKNIFWLQQRPGENSADDAYHDPDARRDYLNEIRSRMTQAGEMVERFAGTQGTQEEGKEVTYTGDPVWLEDVLREALGKRLVVHEGWQDRGTGCGENGSSSMGPIWGVMIHHTGNVKERWEVIRDGVMQPTGWLPGPLSQGLITSDGTFHLVAVGPCNHAGSGCYPGIPDGCGNTRLIGFECAWQPGSHYAGNETWPADQIVTMRDATAAILKKLGYDSSHVIGHKEWAGAENPLGIDTQGKPDPGDMDMKWFRGEVQKAILGVFKKFEKQEPKVEEPKTQMPELTDHALLQQIWVQLLGPDGKGWPQLGGRTLVDALAEVLNGDNAGHLAATNPPALTKPLPTRARRSPAKKKATTRSRNATGAGSLQDA